MGKTPYGRIVRKTWRKDKFKKLPRDLKLLLLYLWTHPEGKNPGIAIINVATIVSDLESIDPESCDPATYNEVVRCVRGRLEELITQGWFKYDWKTKVVFLPKWADYQQPQNKNVVTSFLNYALDLPKCELVTEFLESLRPFADKFEVEIPNLQSDKELNSSGMVNLTVSEPLPKPLANGYPNHSLITRTRTKTKTRNIAGKPAPDKDLLDSKSVRPSIWQQKVAPIIEYLIKRFGELPEGKSYGGLAGKLMQIFEPFGSCGEEVVWILQHHADKPQSPGKLLAYINSFESEQLMEIASDARHNYETSKQGRGNSDHREGTLGDSLSG